MLQYYNMRVKSMVWINGKAFAQREEEKTGTGGEVADFGLKNSGCPMLIRCAIENVRALKNKDSDTV
jgi:hypothetical protein